MALNKVTLGTDIAAAFTKGFNGAISKDVAKDIVTAYNTYAMGALDVSLDGPLTLNKAKMEQIFVGSTEEPTKTLTVNIDYIGLDAVDETHKIYVMLLDNGDGTLATKLQPDKSISTRTGSVIFEGITEPKVYVFAYFDKDGSNSPSVGDHSAVENYKDITEKTSFVQPKNFTFNNTFQLDEGAVTIGTVQPTVDPDVIDGGLPLSTSSGQAAALIAKGVEEYWKMGIFNVDIPATGMASEITASVLTPPVFSSLKAKLKAVFDNKAGTLAGQAQAIADELDAATKLTQVIIIGLSPVNAPVTVIGAIT